MTLYVPMLWMNVLLHVRIEILITLLKRIQVLGIFCSFSW